MVRIKICFSIDRVMAFERADEEKLLPHYKEIDPLPEVPRVGDWINADILPIPLACPFFRNLDWDVKYVEWSKDKSGYFAALHIKPM